MLLDPKHFESHRENWLFNFDQPILLKAAQKKLEFRKSRAEYWVKRKDELEAELRTKGVTITQSESHNLVSNTGAAPKVVLNTDLQKSFAEAHAKIQEHTAAMTEYAAWVNLFSSTVPQSLALTMGDWIYFFGPN